MKWPDDLQREMAKAIDARLHRNEGRARVCARRAAGIAARLYLGQQGVRVGSASALDVLYRLAEEPGLDPGIRSRILLFTLSVDTEFRLPEGIDLIAEAETLCGQLLSQL